MVKIIKDLIGKLDREEITNLQCITMHGQEWVDLHKEWCQVMGVEEDDEVEAEAFINEIRYGDEPDTDEWPEEVQKAINKYAKEDIDTQNTSNSNDVSIEPMELLKEWKNNKSFLDSLKKSEEAVRITLWRYLHSNGGFKTCAKAIGISKNTVKKWWNVRLFIDAALAGGGHMHYPIGLNHDIIKQTILAAVEKVEQEE